MNRSSAPVVTSSFVRGISTFGLAFLAILSTSAFAQTGANSDMQQKLASLKQAAAQNQQKLHSYQWIETSQITLKGEAKPERVSQCSYGADGKVQKIPLGEQPQMQQQSGRQGGKLRQRVVAKKTEEMKDYMQQVQSLLSLYVPPNSQLIQKAIMSKNVSFEKAPAEGPVNITFNDYAKAGDKLTIGFDAAAKQIRTINVSTYMDNPQDAVTLAVRMATLHDGTSYPQQTVLNASAKQIQVVTTNSNYAKLQ